MLGDAIPVPADDLAALRTELELTYEKCKHLPLAVIRICIVPAILAALDRVKSAEGELRKAKNESSIRRVVIDTTAAALAAAREQAEALAGALARLEPLVWLNQNPTTADHHEWNAAVLESRTALAAYRAGRDAGEGAK